MGGLKWQFSQESGRHPPIFKIATILPWPDTSYWKHIFSSQPLAFMDHEDSIDKATCFFLANYSHHPHPSVAIFVIIIKAVKSPRKPWLLQRCQCLTNLDVVWRTFSKRCLDLIVECLSRTVLLQTYRTDISIYSWYCTDINILI